MELAAAVPVVMILLAAGLAAVTATTTQLRCVDAAREAARAAARGDSRAAELGARVGPTGAHIAITSEAGLIRVTVSAPLPDVGWAWSGRIDATAVAEPEPSAADATSAVNPPAATDPRSAADGAPAGPHPADPGSTP